MGWNDRGVKGGHLGCKNLVILEVLTVEGNTQGRNYYKETRLACWKMFVVSTVWSLILFHCTCLQTAHSAAYIMLAFTNSWSTVQKTLNGLYVTYLLCKASLQNITPCNMNLVTVIRFLMGGQASIDLESPVPMVTVPCSLPLLLCVLFRACLSEAA